MVHPPQPSKRDEHGCVTINAGTARETFVIVSLFARRGVDSDCLRDLVPRRVWTSDDIGGVSCLRRRWGKRGRRVRDLAAARNGIRVGICANYQGSIGAVDCNAVNEAVHSRGRIKQILICNSNVEQRVACQVSMGILGAKRVDDNDFR